MLSVIIPCYQVKAHILDVLARVGPEVDRVYVVDDACPEGSGEWVRAGCTDPRVVVYRNPVNLGVGGATLAGFERALHDGADILVKLDGDGQMDPAHIARLVRPIQLGHADYAKGNRFFSPAFLLGMPAARIFGNGALSFFSKISSGYWSVMDPTNGFVAIHARVLRLLPLASIDRRFFFESDLLFRLGTVRAAVTDVPLAAMYNGEKSNLRISKVLWPFFWKNVHRSSKRLLYSYFLRDFNIGSVDILGAVVLLLAGTVHGAWNWAHYASLNTPAPSGTVMLSALLFLLGFQLLLSGINYDILSEPKVPLHPKL